MEHSLWAQLAPVLAGGAIGVVAALVAAVVPELLRTRAERDALSAAIVAEIEGVLAIVERRQFIKGLRDTLAKAEAESDPRIAYWFSFSVRHDPFAVYHANLSRIGLLRSPPAGLVVQFYTGATSVLEDIVDLREGALAEAGRDEAQRRLRELLELFERVRQIGDEIVKAAV